MVFSICFDLYAIYAIYILSLYNYNEKIDKEGVWCQIHRDAHDFFGRHRLETDDVRNEGSFRPSRSSPSLWSSFSCQFPLDKLLANWGTGGFTMIYACMMPHQNLDGFSMIFLYCLFSLSHDDMDGSQAELFAFEDNELISIIIKVYKNVYIYGIYMYILYDTICVYIYINIKPPPRCQKFRGKAPGRCRACRRPSLALGGFTWPMEHLVFLLILFKSQLDMSFQLFVSWCFMRS